MGAGIDLCMRVLTWHLSKFVSMFAPCEGCPYICEFTGARTSLSTERLSFFALCLCSRGKQRDGEHRQGSIDPLCAGRN